jgi:hypothetical protein
MSGMGGVAMTPTPDQLSARAKECEGEGIENDPTIRALQVQLHTPASGEREARQTSRDVPEDDAVGRTCGGAPRSVAARKPAAARGLTPSRAR